MGLVSYMFISVTEKVLRLNRAGELIGGSRITCRRAFGMVGARASEK